MLIIADFQIALYWREKASSNILDYLLVDAWDIENCNNLQRLFWRRLQVLWVPYDSWASKDLNRFSQLSRRMSSLGQVVQADEIYDIVWDSVWGCIQNLTSKEFNYSGLLKFFIDRGADIEFRDSYDMTALLLTAEVDSVLSLRVMRELLWLNADYSAVDYEGRGPLHLTLKLSQIYIVDVEDQGLDFWQAIKGKLVHLLQAGCSVHAVDSYGRTPTDVARRWRRTKTWQAALREVGKLECAKSKCQCEIAVRIPQALRLFEKILRSLRKIVTDAQLTCAEN